MALRVSGSTGRPSRSILGGPNRLILSPTAFGRPALPAPAFRDAFRTVTATD